MDDKKAVKPRQSVKRTRKLTKKRAAFAREYAIHQDATKAAINSGYSKKTASQIGCNLIKNSLVAAEISRVEEKILKKSEKTAEDIIRELERVAFSNMADYVEFGNDGPLVIRDITKMGEDAKRCVSEVSVHEGRNGTKRTFKLYDKIKALELLGKRHGLFKDKIVFEDDMSDEELLAKAAEIVQQHGVGADK